MTRRAASLRTDRFRPRACFIVSIDTVMRRLLVGSASSRERLPPSSVKGLLLSSSYNADRNPEHHLTLKRERLEVGRDFHTVFFFTKSKERAQLVVVFSAEPAERLHHRSALQMFREPDAASELFTTSKHIDEMQVTAVCWF